MSKVSNIAMIEVVAKKLSSLKEDFVYVGGATTAFYIADPTAGKERGGRRT